MNPGPDLDADLPVTSDALKAEIAMLHDYTTAVQARERKLKEHAKELFTAETGVAVGTRVIWHGYARNYRDIDHDHECEVVALSVGWSGAVAPVVVPLTAAGVPGMKRHNLGGYRWSKKP